MEYPITKIRSGDTLLVSRKVRWWNPKDFFSWRIQATTGSKWNHVAVVAWKKSKPVIIEALFNGGVVISDPEKYMTNGYELALSRPAWTTETQGTTAAAFAIIQVGCEYDKAKIIKIRLLQLILGSNGVDLINIDENDDMFICSELAIRAWSAAGRKIGGSFAGPADVAKHTTIYWEKS